MAAAEKLLSAEQSTVKPLKKISINEACIKAKVERDPANLRRSYLTWQVYHSL